MADLPTNYFDDILSESMNGKKKFRLTYRNGTTEEVTIEDISEYVQHGSKFGAGDINKTNQAVNEKFDSGDVVDPMLATKQGFAADAKLTRDAIDGINSNMVASDNTPFRFGVNENGQYGYIVTDSEGADTVIPFKKSNEKIYSIGFGVYNRTQTNKITIDVTNYTKVRICHLYFSYNVNHTNRYFRLVGDGTDIIKLSLPIAIDNPTDGSYEYDITNITTLDMEIKTMHGADAYGMGAIAIS